MAGQDNPTYERVMRTFKKYHPNRGDLINNALDAHVIEGASKKSLKKFERFLMYNEIVHTMSFVLGSFLAVTHAANGDWSGTAFITGVNIFINLPSIMLQEFNKNRLQQIKRDHHR